MIKKLINRYGWFGLVNLICDLISTKFRCRTARLIRGPFYLRGEKHIEFGCGLTTGVGVRIDAFPEVGIGGIVVKIGERVQINDYVHIAGSKRVEIGDDVMIASRVFISDHNHGEYQSSKPMCGPETPPSQRPIISNMVIVGDRVWIGEGVCILPGVSIGNGSVIGAGAIVTKSVPANCVAVGNPARIVKRYNPVSMSWEKV